MDSLSSISSGVLFELKRTAKDVIPDMTTHRFRQLIQGLFIISRQVRSCERKLNKLLEKQGEDAKLLELSEHLHESSEALQTAIDSQKLRPNQKDK